MGLGVYYGISGKGNSTRKITIDNVQVSSEASWEEIGDLINAKYDFSGALVKNTVYTFDGRGASGNHIMAAEKFNLETKIPSAIAQQSTKFVMNYACESDGDDNIFVFGGINNYGATTSWLFRYNVSSNRYFDETDMPFQSATHLAIRVSDSEILVTQPMSGTAIYLFNFKTKTWSKELQITTIALQYASAVLYENKVYIVHRTKIYVYNLTEKTLETLSITLSGKIKPYVFLIGSKIYISGGTISGVYNNTTEVFDIATGLPPTSGKPLLSAKSSGFVIVKEGNAWIFGGQPINKSVQKFIPESEGIKDSLDIINNSVVNLTKEFTYNNERKMANTNHELTGPGILKITNNNTSGTIIEQIKDITLNQL